MAHDHDKMDTVYFNQIPFEIVQEIFKYVPEYGFLVCRELHAVAEYYEYNFYCDIKHFRLIVGKRLSSVRLAYRIISYCLTDPEDEDGNIQDVVPVFKDIDNFEPWIWAMNLCREAPIEVINDILDNGNNKYYCNEHILYRVALSLKIVYDPLEFDHDRLIHGHYEHVCKFWAPIIAYKSDLMTYDEAFKKIWADNWNDPQEIIDLLSFVLLCTSGKLYETLITMFKGLMPKIVRKLLWRANVSRKFSDAEMVDYMNNYGVEDLTVMDINKRPKCIEHFIKIVHIKYADDPIMRANKLYEISLDLVKLRISGR